MNQRSTWKYIINHEWKKLHCYWNFKICTAPQCMAANLEPETINKCFRDWNSQLGTSAFVDSVTNESADHWPTYFSVTCIFDGIIRVTMTTTSQSDFNFEHKADETASAEIDNCFLKGWKLGSYMFPRQSNPTTSLLICWWQPTMKSRLERETQTK